MGEEEEEEEQQKRIKEKKNRGKEIKIILLVNWNYKFKERRERKETKETDETERKESNEWKNERKRKKKKKKKKKTQDKNHDEKHASFDGRKQANNKGVRLERLAVACHGPCQANTVNRKSQCDWSVSHCVFKIGPWGDFFSDVWKLSGGWKPPPAFSSPILVQIEIWKK